MNKYIVAYISLFENELKQVLVEADSELAAAYKYLAEKDDLIFDESERHSSLDELKDAMFENISVYKLD